MEHAVPYALMNRQPLYPEPIGFTAPRGTRARLRAAAERAGLPAAELLRRALAGVLTETAGQPRAIVET